MKKTKPPRFRTTFLSTKPKNCSSAALPGSGNCEKKDSLFLNSEVKIITVYLTLLITWRKTAEVKSSKANKHRSLKHVIPR